VAQLQEGDIVDVIAIPSKVSDVVQVPSKKDPSSPLVKRTISLIDDSRFSIDLTLFGEMAEGWSQDGNPVMVFKNIKVTDFNGRSLTATRQSRWEVEPNISRTQQLHNYTATQNMDDIQLLTRTQGSMSGHAAYKSLRDARNEVSGQPGKSILFSCQATILMIKHDENASMYYLACPQQGCNKKVTPDNQTNSWYCSKCAKNYPNFLARYVLFVRISDDTLSDVATMFNDAATDLLGKQANEIKVMRENNDPELEYLFDCAIQKKFNFKIKANEETYQDESKVKFTIQTIEPINYYEESKIILEKIQNLLAV